VNYTTEELKLLRASLRGALGLREEIKPPKPPKMFKRERTGRNRPVRSKGTYSLMRDELSVAHEEVSHVFQEPAIKPVEARKKVAETFEGLDPFQKEDVSLSSYPLPKGHNRRPFMLSEVSIVEEDEDIPDADQSPTRVHPSEVLDKVLSKDREHVRSHRHKKHYHATANPSYLELSRLSELAFVSYLRGRAHAWIERSPQDLDLPGVRVWVSRRDPRYRVVCRNGHIYDKIEAVTHVANAEGKPIRNMHFILANMV